MKTYEMVDMAEKYGETYMCGEMYYNSVKGFHSLHDSVWDANAFNNYTDEEDRRDLHAFVMLDDWRIIPRKKVTMKEVEEKFGCKVEIIK